MTIDPEKLYDLFEIPCLGELYDEYSLPEAIALLRGIPFQNIYIKNNQAFINESKGFILDRISYNRQLNLLVKEIFEGKYDDERNKIIYFEMPDEMGMDTHIDLYNSKISKDFFINYMITEHDIDINRQFEVIRARLMNNYLNPDESIESIASIATKLKLAFTKYRKEVEHVESLKSEIETLNRQKNDEIEKLEAENLKLKKLLEAAENRERGLSETLGYLDRNNKHFSIEMKLSHEVWNEIYLNRNESDSETHSTLVEQYLNNYSGVTQNAIDRISAVTNPKESFAKSKINKGF